MPKVSVIIPVYNMEKYLNQCLESVINQTLKDIEIICVDDCSTDNSLAILKEYASIDNRIILIEQVENQGQGAARNKALNYVKGEYIMFLDSDDWYELDACEKAYNCIYQNQTDISFFNYFEYNDKLGIDEKRNRVSVFSETNNLNCFSLKDVKTQYMKTAWVCLQIYSSAFVLKNNIKFSETHNCEDVLFSFSALIYANKVSVLKEYLYHYRKLSQGLKLLPERINYWKDVFDNKMFMYDVVCNVKDKDSFIRQYVIYLINTTFNRYIPYVKVTKNKKLAKEMYEAAHEVAEILSKNHNIESIKEDISYSDFYDFVISKTCIAYSFRRFLSNIFSIRSDYKHNVVIVLWLKFKIKKFSQTKSSFEK